MTLQSEIIQELHVLPEIDAANEIRKRVDFLKAYLKAHPFLKTFVLGISGGQDSTLAGRLAQIAMEEIRQETNDSDYYFIAIRLPYGTQADEADAKKALDFIQPDSQIVVNIQEAVDGQVHALSQVGVDVSDFQKGNIKARQRMIAQYAVAGTFSGAVIGTDHAAENLTGFFTKFGDGGADLVPLFGLNKRQGRQLLAELECPEELYLKIPTADLEENQPLLPDETALGVSYEAIDDYLEGKIVDASAKERIETLWKKGMHKRRLPITLEDTFWKN